MTYTDCHSCSFRNFGNGKSCMGCGALLDKQADQLALSKYNMCKNCGFANFITNKKCVRCGHNLQTGPVEKRSNTRNRRSMGEMGDPFVEVPVSRICEKLGMGKHVFKKPPDNFKPYEFGK